MAVQEGLTAQQVVKLLELAKKAGKRCHIKTADKDVRSTPGRAILLGMANKNAALIKPFNHGGKEEIVFLSNLRAWRGGCDFDISDIFNMNLTISTQSVDAIESTNHIKFVIFSKKMKAVWGGDNRRWVSDVQRASKWAEQHKSFAQRALGKINKIPTQDDAVVMTVEEAENAVFEIFAVRPPGKQPVCQINNVQVPASVYSPQSLFPSSNVTIVNPMQTTKYQQSSDEEILDMDTLLNSNETALRLAESERKKAGEEYMNLKRLTIEALEHIRQLNDAVVKLGGRSAMRISQPLHVHVKKGSRVLLRFRIQKILLTCSKLDSRSIHNRILAEIPNLEIIKTQQCLSSMKSDDLVELNGRGWSLTSKGKNAEMMIT